jgi:uncharacterized SAM-binding protein YcdF (DUF218 family)
MPQLPPFPLRGSTPEADFDAVNSLYAQAAAPAAQLLSFLAPRDTFPVRVECIVILGNDFELSAATGASLFAALSPQVVVCAGGRGRFTPAGWPSEGEHFAQILSAAGVPASRVLIDDKSTNTSENLEYAFRLLKTQAIAPRTLVVIQYPLLQLRAIQTARRIFAEAEEILSCPAFLPSFVEPPSGWPLVEWRRRLLWDAVGEVFRLHAYQHPSQGYIAKLRIPALVTAAAVRAGELICRDTSAPPEHRAQLADTVQKLKQF